MEEYRVEKNPYAKNVRICLEVPEMLKFDKCIMMWYNKGNVFF